MGTIDGRLVGCGNVGSNVGVKVGLDVGVGVGANDGIPDGALVGVLVGIFVGKKVGTFVGAEVGALVGAEVGALVGALVGVDVGVKVGAKVGSSVCPEIGTAWKIRIPTRTTGKKKLKTFEFFILRKGNLMRFSNSSIRGLLHVMRQLRINDCGTLLQRWNTSLSS